MPEERQLPVWRSLLFVPAHRDKYIDKAHTRGADAIQLDLEDSVPTGEKEAARANVKSAAERVSRHGLDVTVRINRPWRMAIKDLEAAVCPQVMAFALPKVESAQHVQLLSEVVTELEAERGMRVGATRFIVMIESPGAFLQAREILTADPRNVAAVLGAEDFALSVGMQPEAEGLFYPKMHVLIAARAAGVIPLGFIGTVADFRDMDQFRETVRRSRRLGFQGATCIHPDQVQVLNEEFGITEEEVGKARQVLEAYDRATAVGLGAIELDGKMVDEPIVERARRVLARYRRIQERQT